MKRMLFTILLSITSHFIELQLLNQGFKTNKKLSSSLPTHNY
jgi:hypothetical protein